VKKLMRVICVFPVGKLKTDPSPELIVEILYSSWVYPQALEAAIRPRVKSLLLPVESPATRCISATQAWDTRETAGFLI
jgi:hypothetical protein